MRVCFRVAAGMESIEFLGVIAVVALIAGWYFLNEEKGADGELGPLALRPDVHPKEIKKTRGRYRIKPRASQRMTGARSVESARTQENAKPAYRELDDAARARRRFRRQDDVRYQVKNRKAGKYELRDRDD